MLSVTVTIFPGRIVEGVMLAANQDWMRIALRGAADTLEVRRVGDRWIGDDDRPVDFEVLLTDGHAELDMFEQVQPRAMAAGRG